mgnify:FL=1
MLLTLMFFTHEKKSELYQLVILLFLFCDAKLQKNIL